MVFEEWGGNPDWISLVKREIGSVCADIYEYQPTLMNWQMKAYGKVSKPLRPKAHLWCAPGQKISSIKFASFGTPMGGCGSFREGSCHAHKSYDIFEKVYCILLYLIPSFIFFSHSVLSMQKICWFYVIRLYKFPEMQPTQPCGESFCFITFLKWYLYQIAG